MDDQELSSEFKKGIDLRNSGHLKEAIAVFNNVLKTNPDHPKTAGILTVLAGVYNDLGDPINAIKNLQSATQISPKSEMASLGLYLSYVEIDEYEMAVKELKRYLDKYPAKNYKITLMELLGDLESGYALTYKKIILELAEKNGIRLGQG